MIHPLLTEKTTDGCFEIRPVGSTICFYARIISFIGSEYHRSCSEGPALCFGLSPNRAKVFKTNTAFLRPKCEHERFRHEIAKMRVDAMTFFGDMPGSFGMCAVGVRVELNIEKIDTTTLRNTSGPFPQYHG